jgi:hypothetical protein
MLLILPPGDSFGRRRLARQPSSLASEDDSIPAHKGNSRSASFVPRERVLGKLRCSGNRAPFRRRFQGNAFPLVRVLARALRLTV